MLWEEPAKILKFTGQNDNKHQTPAKEVIIKRSNLLACWYFIHSWFSATFKWIFCGIHQFSKSHKTSEQFTSLYWLWWFFNFSRQDFSIWSRTWMYDLFIATMWFGCTTLELEKTRLSVSQVFLQRLQLDSQVPSSLDLNKLVISNILFLKLLLLMTN